MADFTLRWANRSQSTQDWLISNGDNFTLQSDHVRTVNITINANYTYQIAVSTNGGYAAANLVYTAATQTWALNSHTPNEFALATGGGIVTVRCFLEDVAGSGFAGPEYRAEEPREEPGA